MKLRFADKNLNVLQSSHARTILLSYLEREHRFCNLQPAEARKRIDEASRGQM